jgi:hypothetical protein
MFVAAAAHYKEPDFLNAAARRQQAFGKPILCLFL